MLCGKRNASAVSLCMLGILLTGCQNYPEIPQQNVVDPAGAVSAGAGVAPNGRLLAGLVGGKLGETGGYLVGADWTKIREKRTDQAIAAVTKAADKPATVADVARSDTADLNHDGFITLDEIIAMQQAGLSAPQINERLEKSHQYIELTREQAQYLAQHHVPTEVVSAMGYAGLGAEAGTASLRSSPDAN